MRSSRPSFAVRSLRGLALLSTLAACARPVVVQGDAPGASRVASLGALPRTRAERTGYTETTRYEEVVAFLDSLRRAGAAITLGDIGATSEGRRIPYVIASRPLVATPEEARRLGRPIVYVQGNIHGGEVEGKEALLALLRDLVASPRRNALDSIVLVAVPIYNADGNEALGPQERNRSEQNGPERIGQRPNAQGLDLNRDYIKADAPETRASLAMFAAWNPDVFVDLHTTNGSYHGYALTYSPSLTPAAAVGAFDGGGYARDTLLPILRRRMRERRSFEIFDYGNFVSNDSVQRGWFTYDHRPRFGTNYYALRGGISILSEAYSHDPLERRVQSTYAFVAELLSLVAERGAEVRAVTSRARGATAAWERVDGEAPRLPIRSRLTTRPFLGDIIWEELARTGDSSRTEPGVPRGIRRTGRFHTSRIPIHDRFEPVLTTSLPWAYLVSSTDSTARQLLRLHGITVERLTGDCRGAAVETFAVDSAIVAPRPFQNRREVRAEGRWRRSSEGSIPAGTLVVRTGQPLGVLAAVLLEPQSDDGLVTWDIGARATAGGGAPGAARLTARPGSACTTAPLP